MKISFSGSSYSGKTYTLNKFRNNTLYTVYDELIRDKNLSIDEIRKDHHKYLLLQKEIVYGKIRQERIVEYNRIIYDRSLADSIYYGMTYLSQKDLGIDFYKYIGTLTDEINFNKTLIDYVLFFKPISDCKNHNDKLRPINLSDIQMKESDIIFTLNCLIYGYNKVIVVDSISDNIENIIDELYENN